MVRDVTVCFDKSMQYWRLFLRDGGVIIHSTYTQYIDGIVDIIKDWVENGVKR